MRLLVKKGKEFAPEPPDDPKADKDGKISEVDKLTFKSEYDNYKHEEKQYNQHKAKVFLLILGQCTANMKRKIEYNRDFDEIEENHDVIKLINLIRRLSYSDVDAKYKFWTVAHDFRKLAEIKQRNNETLDAYYKRFVNLNKVMESRWGKLVPIKLAQDETNYKKKEDEAKKNANNKMMACLFLTGMDMARYSRCIDELNNSYMGGKINNYPRTIKDAVEYVEEYSNIMHRGNNKKGVVMANLADKTCYTCGEKGHISSGCPKNKKDESTAMNAAQLDEDTSTALALPHAPSPP